MWNSFTSSVFLKYSLMGTARIKFDKETDKGSKKSDWSIERSKEGT